MTRPGIFLLRFVLKYYRGIPDHRSGKKQRVVAKRPSNDPGKNGARSLAKSEH